MERGGIKLSSYRRGSIWLINFDPQVGTEIKKTRPGLIISHSKFNQVRSKVTVLPITNFEPLRKNKSARVVVEASADNGLKKKSEIIAIEPATFDKKRFIQFFGDLEVELLELVTKKLVLYLS
ncbi:hypothetical protein NIES4102_43140 (plasmid) [Chondrocystis sp. NIES-4102]|nr:hypothetical protein NIES4102_43140 [Chondrocystis sp. NIES-4102]